MLKRKTLVVLIASISIGFLVSALAITAQATQLVFPFGCGSAYFKVAPQPTPEGLLSVPLDIVVASSDNQRVSYTDEDIREIITFANEVWSPASITFTTTSISRIAVSDDAVDLGRDDVSSLIEFGKAHIGKKFEDNVIDVIFIKSFKDLPDGGGKGLQLNGHAAVFINEYESDYRAKWTLAHEIGHTLNLCDVVQNDNLMVDYTLSSTNGFRPNHLTAEQIQTVRYSAYYVHCADNSCSASRSTP